MLEMRLGKTPTFLNEFMLLKRDHGIRRSVMFAPNKYKRTWATEATKFGIDVPAFAFDSKNREEAEEFIAKNPEFLLAVNYEALTYNDTIKILRGICDDTTFLGADESIIIKNNESNFFKQAHDLSKSVKFVRAMSGKPVVQGPHDLYSQMRFIKHLNGWTYSNFKAAFAEKGGHMGRQIVGVKNVERLQPLMDECMFFARRSDWMKSFEPDTQMRMLDMTPLQKRHYDEMEEEFTVWLDSGTVTVEQVITKRMKMQQISSGFIYDENRVARVFEDFASTPKFKDLKEILETEINNKWIVVAHYGQTLDSLIENLKGYKPAIIRGDEYMRKHKLTTESEKNRFNNDPTCRGMIAQSKAIKYGHTLMGTLEDPCLYTIFFENTYSLDDRAQVEQRNQGADQVGTTTLIDFACSEIEVQTIDALIKKENIAAKIMGYYKKGTI